MLVANTSDAAMLRGCEIPQVAGEAERFVRERLDEAMRRADLDPDKRGSARKLALLVGVHQSQVKYWRERKTTPTGENLARLCEVLQTTPAYLFGRDEPQNDRERALEMLREHVGAAEADAVATLGRLPPDARRRAVERLQDFVDGLLAAAGKDPAPSPAPSPRAMPLTPYDFDREAEEAILSERRAVYEERPTSRPSSTEETPAPPRRSR